MKLLRGAVDAEILGNGTTLMLLHSLIADRGSFAKVAPALADHFRVVIPSLPGFAGSECVDGGLEGVAGRMAQALSEVSGDGKALVLGNGYGGFVALILALRHPELVSCLVLADSGAKFSESGREAFRKMAGTAAAAGLETVATVAMRRLFTNAFIEANPGQVEQRRDAFVALNPDVFIAACNDLAELDLLEDATRLAVPLLVLVGEHDEATPPAMSRELADCVPGAQLKILPGCAHVPQLQAPELFLEAVVPFLLEHE
jgi:3-oxoadipate enol-lactonase